MCGGGGVVSRSIIQRYPEVAGVVEGGKKGGGEGGQKGWLVS